MRALIFFGTLLCLAPPVFAEVTKTLTLELAGDPSAPFAVENLAGAMRVVPGSGSGVSATATVHAESEDILGLVRFEQVVGARGVRTLRVRYPVQKYTSYRYPQKKGESLLSRLFDWSSSDSDYDGVSVHVAAGSGVLLYADVEIQVPAKALDGTFRNRVGSLSGRGLEGRTHFELGEGNIALEQMGGDTRAETGAGNVNAHGLSGSFRCDTGSGECVVADFKGGSLLLDTGSGRVRASSASAGLIEASTGSGSVELSDIDAESIKGDTGSGSLDIDNRGRRLKSVKFDTGSGDVTLRLEPTSGFRARASLGSGQIKCRFTDARPVMDDDEIVGYDRGDGRIEIKVDAGSGSVLLEPRP
jgi:hypothetical protein